jgi:hypothetical protein
MCRRKTKTTEDAELEWRESDLGRAFERSEHRGKIGRLI